jgi:hypothetical protein
VGNLGGDALWDRTTRYTVLQAVVGTTGGESRTSYFQEMPHNLFKGVKVEIAFVFQPIEKRDIQVTK